MGLLRLCSLRVEGNGKSDTGTDSEKPDCYSARSRGIDEYNDEDNDDNGMHDQKPSLYSCLITRHSSFLSPSSSFLQAPPIPIVPVIISTSFTLPIPLPPPPPPPPSQTISPLTMMNTGWEGYLSKTRTNRASWGGVAVVGGLRSAVRALCRCTVPYVGSTRKSRQS